MIRTILTLASVFLFLASSGCTAVHTLGKGNADYEEALTFSINEEKPVIYVTRLVDDLSGIALTIDIDDRTITTSRNTFFRIELEPGFHELEAHIPDVLGSDGEIAQQFEPGKLYFYRMEAETRILLPDVMHLEPINEQTAKLLITQNNLRMLDLKEMME